MAYQPLLHLHALSETEIDLPIGPWRNDRALSANPVRQMPHRNRIRVGFVIGHDRIEVLRHEESGAVDSLRNDDKSFRVASSEISVDRLHADLPPLGNRARAGPAYERAVETGGQRHFPPPRARRRPTRSGKVICR